MYLHPLISTESAFYLYLLQILAMFFFYVPFTEFHMCNLNCWSYLFVLWFSLSLNVYDLLWCCQESSQYSQSWLSSVWSWLLNVKTSRLLLHLTFLEKRIVRFKRLQASYGIKVYLVSVFWHSLVLSFHGEYFLQWKVSNCSVCFVLFLAQ